MKTVKRVYVEITYIVPADEFSAEALEAMADGDDQLAIERVYDWGPELDDVWNPYSITCHEESWEENDA